MQQVLFRLPFVDWPIYGYGSMLFLAFIFCTWLASKLGRRDGIPREAFQDLSLWLFVFGILGARLTYYFQYPDRFPNFAQIVAIWDGGLVFYGSLPGALLGYVLAQRFQLKQYGINHWRMADIVAPCLCLGLALGRIGCLLNGCCFGNVACTHCPAATFPLSSPPRFAMVERGYQTAAGFGVNNVSDDFPVVAFVEPGSVVAGAGLRAGDVITKINGKGLKEIKVTVRAEEEGKVKEIVLSPIAALDYLLKDGWPRGRNDLSLEVRDANGEARTIGPIWPRTIGLHPTQLYETISMTLLMLVLLAYFPLRRYEGSVMVLWMFAYGVHRFLNEMLRTDTDPVLLGMTLSQNISIVIFACATVLAIIVRRRKPIDPNAPDASVPQADPAPNPPSTAPIPEAPAPETLS